MFLPLGDLFSEVHNYQALTKKAIINNYGIIIDYPNKITYNLIQIIYIV